MYRLNPLLYRQIIEDEIKNDIHVGGDITTDIFFPPEHRSTAKLVSREHGVLAGLEAALYAFRLLDNNAEFTILKSDGDKLEKGSEICRISSHTRALLTAERTALNILSHLSGIASATRAFVELAGNTSISETRKTLPGLRSLQKYAVRCGGGKNHRYSLDGAVMVKDNHRDAAGSWEDAITSLRSHIGHTTKIEIEVDSMEEFKEVISLHPDIVLLDNFTNSELQAAVQLRNTEAPGIILEASGTLTLDKVEAVTACGVDVISSGALTHSVKALDIGLDIS
jgi:nicotinate-nucleotide pyrophosphorylase (carboxylating)